MRVAGTNICLNKLHVPYDIPAASNVSTPPCMRVAGINLFNKSYVPFDIPAASYVSTPPSMRVAGIILNNKLYVYQHVCAMFANVDPRR